MCRKTRSLHTCQEMRRTCGYMEGENTRFSISLLHSRSGKKIVGVTFNFGILDLFLTKILLKTVGKLCLYCKYILTAKIIFSVHEGKKYFEHLRSQENFMNEVYQFTRLTKLLVSSYNSDRWHGNSPGFRHMKPFRFFQNSKIEITLYLYISAWEKVR